jgi:hypothetical protein
MCRTHKEITWTANPYPPVPRHVVCAAVKFDTGLVITGARHWDSVMRNIVEFGFGGFSKFRDYHTEVSQGFIDQYGEYMTRTEAAYIVNANNQHLRAVNPETITGLFSEDLY